MGVMIYNIPNRESHLKTPHSLKFKDAIIGQEMFSRKGKGDEFEILFPEV